MCDVKYVLAIFDLPLSKEDLTRPPCSVLPTLSDDFQPLKLDILRLSDVIWGCSLTDKNDQAIPYK